MKPVPVRATPGTMLREQTASGTLSPASGELCVSCGATELDARCNACGAALRAGDYKIVKMISQTAHSRVYLAQSADGKRVALKELLFSLVPTVQQLEAFEREAEVLSTLSHPAIPKILGSFKTGQGPLTRLYLAVEFIEGETLEAALKRGPLAEKEVREVCRAVLEVLVYLHGRSPPVLHRDIKPANLIRRPDGSIAVVDFGSAREVARGQTHSATLVGTIGYMPLEQLGGTVGPRSDLYALGATAVHLLTGVSPADTFNADGSIRLDGNPMRRFLSAMVAARASERFPSAALALEALRTPDMDPRPAQPSSREAPRPERLEGSPLTARNSPREEQSEEDVPRKPRSKALALGVLVSIGVTLATLGGAGFVRASRPPRAVPATQVQPPQVRRWTVNETFSSNGFQFTVVNVRQELSWSRSGDLWTGVELEVAAPANNSTLDWTRLLTVDTTHGPMLPSTVGEAPNSSNRPLQLKAGVTRKFALNFFGPRGWDAVSVTLPDGRVVPLKPSR